MKKAKRALALALVFALVASFCVTGAAAAPGPGEQQTVVNGQYVGGEWQQGGDGSYTDSTSGVKVSKTATATSAENQYEVTLEVEVPVTTSTKSASAATVLVIDVSNSMDYCDQCGGEYEHKWDCGYNGPGYRDDDVEYNQTRLHAAKEAATAFVNGYSDTENNTPRYVAIVSFGQYGHNVSYWYDVSTYNGYNAVIDAIDGLDTPGYDNGGTNLDGGLSKAEGLFKGSDNFEIIGGVPQENRFAIALTDGRPTYSEHEGSGTSCNQDILDDTKETADGLKNEAKLYTVCFGAADEVCWEGGLFEEDGPTVGDFLEDSIASSGCAYEANDGDALNNIFNQLTDEIKDSLKNLTVTDPMATGVTLDRSSIEDSGAEVNGQTINWTLSNYTESGETRTYTLTYTVTVDPDKFEGQEEGYYPLNGETYLTIPSTGGQTGGTVQFPVPGVFVTPTVTENSGSIIIQVYVDGKLIAIDGSNFATYISGLQNGTNTTNWSQDYSDGKIVGTYNYEQFDSADIVLTPNGNYVLQGIEGTFIQGETAWTGITPSGAGWKIDNVMGGSTLKVYLNTKYSVEYAVPTGFNAPEDELVYVTGEGVKNANMDEVTDNEGAVRSWVNSGLKTSITIKPLPTGTTGWTDEATPTGTHDKDDEIGVADAVTGGLDADGDHTFTFTATAVNYTVTYTDGVEGIEVFADQIYDNLTYGTATPGFKGTPERDGYTFAGWLPEVAATVTGDATYTATWTADEDTTYTVEYYFENLEDDGFTIDDSQTVNGSGTTGDKVEAEQKEFAGFTFDAGNEDNVTSGTIAGDGSLVLKLYYVRNTYTVTYTDGVEDEEVFDDQVTSDIKYGAATPDFLVDGSPADPEREGYTFEGWLPEVAETVTETVTYVAQWEEITGALTVTKTFSGLDEDVLPSNFAITVAKDGETVKTLELKDAQVNGTTYTWTINDLSLWTYTVSESGYEVEGYLCESDGPETVTISNDEGASVTLNNSYTAISRELVVTKTVVKVGDAEVAEGATTIPAAKVGDTIIYKIVVTNNSNVALTKISVTDTLVNNVLYSDEECTKTASATIESLNAGERATFYAKYTVQEDDAGTKLTNTATAEDEDGTKGGDNVPVEVKEQYTLKINYHYDEVSGKPFKTEEHTLNEGDSWSVSTETDATHVAPKTVTRVLDGANVNYMLDTSLPQSGTMGEADVTVDLVYVKDEWDDEDDSETGGDGTPDYQQALIKYEAETGGTVDPTINVETLTDVADGIYKGSVTADSTATPAAGNVFVNWTHEDNEVSSSAGLDYAFTAEGGRIYVFTAHFRAGTTSATVDKQLASYVRGDAEPAEIPEGFKARVGDVLNYKITIENTGDIALKDVTVSDTLWGKGVASAMVGGTDTDVSGGSCTVDVASGNSVTITYSYTVQADDIGKTITNTATVDLPGDDDPKDEEEVTVDDYSVTITPADIVAYTGGDGYSAVVGEDNQYINDSTSGLPEPGYHVVLSDAVVDWLNDNGVAAGDGLTDDATDLADVLSFTYDDGTNKRNWSLRYVGVYSYNASGNPSAYVYSIVTETAGAPSVSLKYFDDLNGDGVADDNEVITSDDIMMSANQVNHTYKMTIEGGDLDQSQVKAVLEADGKSLTTDIDIGIGELTVLSTTNEETTNSIAGNAAGVDSGVITAVGNDSITYYVNESGVSFNDEDLVSRVQLLIDEVTNETSGEFETAMAEAAFDAISADLRNAEYEMCYMDLVDTENGNAKVTFSGGELSIYWPLPDGASASDSFYIVHFTELDREHAAVGTDVLDTTNKDVIAGEVMRIGGEYYVTFDVGSFSPFVLVYGDEGGGRPIIPVPDPDDGDDEEEEFVPKWLNIDDHYAYIIGYEDGTVRPQGNITRAEVATIFFRLLTDEVREEYWSTESGYSDVSSSDWYNNAISTLSNLGVITGYEDGTFRPNASISRAEFVTIATRFFDYTAEYEGTFSDVSYSSWYADFVQAAVDMGLVNGYENGTFRPNASITRAEAVAIVNRVLLRRPDAEHLLSWAVMNTFSDNADTAAWYYADIQEATNSHDYDWITYSGERIEDWTEKLEKRDWAALEREWSSAYDAPGGEVTG